MIFLLVSADDGGFLLVFRGNALCKTKKGWRWFSASPEEIGGEGGESGAADVAMTAELEQKLGFVLISYWLESGN